MPRGGRRPGAGRKPKNYAALLEQGLVQPKTLPPLPPPARASRARTPEEEAEEADRIAKAGRKRMQEQSAHNEELKARYRILGAMPTDPLAAVDHTLKILQTSVDEVLEDGSLTAKERRNELRQIARSMIPLLPVARLYKAEKHIRGSVEVTQRDRRDPPTAQAPEDEDSLTLDS